MLTEEYEPGPVGGYRCSLYQRASCRVKLKKLSNNRIEIYSKDSVGHVHPPSPFYIQKYKMYKSLRREAAQSDDSNSKIVSRVKNSSQ